MAADCSPKTTTKRKRSVNGRASRVLGRRDRDDVLGVAREALARVVPHELAVLHLQVEEAVVLHALARVGLHVEAAAVPGGDALERLDQALPGDVAPEGAERLGEQEAGREGLHAERGELAAGVLGPLLVDLEG